MVMIYGLTSVTEPEARFPTVYFHLGIIDYITRHHTVDPYYDAYFNWPGFFILAAFIQAVTHTPSASLLAFTAWAPLISSALYLGPLWILVSGITPDKKLCWLAILFFYIFDWIGQDYFSPQGLNYVLYLLLLGILVTSFRTVTGQSFRAALASLSTSQASARLPWRPALSRTIHNGTWRGAAQAIFLLSLVLALIVTSIVSHQLTPFAMLVQVTGLVLIGRIRTRLLPLFILVAALTWVSYMAEPFLAGNIKMLIGDLGSVNGSVNANVSGRLHGSAQHAVILKICEGITVLLWALAGVGEAFLLWTGRRDPIPVVLGFAPFCLLVLQSYGGEMLLRVYLFGLPGMAFLAAALFRGDLTKHISMVRTATLFILGSIVVVLFLFARYGNERMDYVRHGDLAAVRFFYAVAPPHAAFLGLVPYSPFGLERIEVYTYDTLEPLSFSLETDKEGVARGNTIIPLINKLRSFCPRPSYFTISPEQIAEIELFSGVPSSSIARYMGLLHSSKSLQKVFNFDGAQVYRLAHGCRN